MMRVLMLYNDYLEAGGERVSVATEAAALSRAGVDVELFRATNDRLASSGVIGKAIASFPNSAIRDEIGDVLDRFRPDVVHAQNLFPQLGAAAIDAIAERDIPWVRTLRNFRLSCIAATFVRDGAPCTSCLGHLGRIPGVMHACYRESRVASVGATNYALWERAAERRYPPSAYIAISRAVREKLRHEFGPEERVHVAHNAVLEFVGERPARISDRPIDVLFAGRFAVEKGIRIVVQMAQEMADHRFVLAGTGPETAAVEAALSGLSNVRLAGALGSGTTLGLMATSKVVVVPSTWDEPFGRVAAEALAVGALPLVSNRGGLPEIVEYAPYRAVIADERASAWTTAASSLLKSSPGELERHSSWASERWRAHFSPEAISDRLVSVYSQVLERP